MDAGTWRGIFTAVMLLLFVAIAIWAYSRRRHADFEEAARLPLDDDPPGTYRIPDPPTEAADTDARPAPPATRS